MNRKAVLKLLGSVLVLGLCVVPGFVLSGWFGTTGTAREGVPVSREQASTKGQSVAVADSFDFPLGAPDGTGYGPYATTDYDVQNPDLVGPSGCFGVAMSQLWHAGEDWFKDENASGTAGDVVTAVANGRVRFADPDYDYPGTVVIIQHDLPDGSIVYSMYGHLQQDLYVAVDQEVTRGQSIGTIYNQGNNSHLHWEIRDFLDGSAICASSGVPGPGYTYPEHPDEKGYTDPTDFINAHRSVQPSCPPENCIPGNEVGRDFFVQVLERLADVPVSDFAVDALELWEPYENTLACWNPLATTWEMEVVCDFNSAGVQHYQSQDMGTQATANTLAQGCYDNIRRMLRLEEFNREGLRADLDVWGTCSDQGCDSLLNEWEVLWNDQGGGSDLRQAGNLEISPSNPQVNQETTFSFEVHNYGDESLTLQNIGPGGKGPPNGQGGDWNALTQNITVGGHQTVPVSASRVFGEGTWCVEKIVFQRRDGGWFDLPANGYQQAKCFEVGSVPPQPHPGEVPDNPGSGWVYKEPDTWQSGIWTYHDDATLHWDVPEANCDLGIYQYRAYFGPNPSGLGGDSDNLLDNEIVPSNEVTVGPIDSSGTYYLRLSTENDCCCENGEGSWDENRQCFRCRNTNWDTVFIYKLDNLEPPNPDHATDLRGSQSGQWTYHDDTTFVWDIPSDPGGSGVKEYHIYFGMDPGGTSDDTVSIPQLAVGPMTEWGTYYLRINTEDNAGNRTGIWTVGEGVWDTIFTYRFDNGEPPNPVLATETHGVQSGEATDINDPTFTWDEPVDPGGSGICCYHIYFGQDSQGTSDTIVSDEQYSPGVLGSAGVYYLRINTEDNAGNRTGIWTTGDGVWNTIFTYNYQTSTPTPTATPTPTTTPTPSDTTPPTGEIISPPPDSYINGDQVDIVATASDDRSGVVGLQFFVWYDDGNGYDWHGLPLDWDGSDGWTSVWDTSSVEDQGSIWFWIYIFDYAGNMGAYSQGGIILDRVPPCVLFGDFTCDCDVDVQDIQEVASRWRMVETDSNWDALYDLDGDGIITVVDIMKVSAHWGDTCELLAATLRPSGMEIERPTQPPAPKSIP